MSEMGSVDITVAEGIARVKFFHPKKNSLPGQLLRNIAQKITEAGENSEARVVVVESDGDGPFCAGASFDELLAIDDMAKGKEFFMGFAHVIMAMKKCPKLIIARVQGKVVGGGVGVVSAADYALASARASVKLSELAIGIGPFVIGPAVERRVGRSAFGVLGIDTEWRDAEWCKTHDLYADVLENTEKLDEAVNTLAQRLAKSNPEAMADLKQVLWQGTDDWQQVLEERAAISGRLVLSEYTRNAIQAFKQS